MDGFLNISIFCQVVSLTIASFCVYMTIVNKFGSYMITIVEELELIICLTRILYDSLGFYILFIFGYISLFYFNILWSYVTN